LRQIHVESRLDHGLHGFVRKAPPAVEGVIVSLDALLGVTPKV